MGILQSGIAAQGGFPVKHWSLATLRENLNKLEPKVVRHAKYVKFGMAGVAVPRELFAAIRPPEHEGDCGKSRQTGMMAGRIVG